MTSRLRIVMTAAVSLALLSGCGRSVTLTPVTMDADVTRSCQQMESRLPEQLGGQRPLVVEPEDPTTAAWGAPPIIWRCGVSEPGALTRTSQLIEVNGVEWLPESLSEGTRFTSLADEPRIELTVPNAYPNPVDLLVEL